MKGPIRYTDRATPDLAAILIRSARQDVAPAGSREAALAAVQIAVGSMATAAPVSFGAAAPGLPWSFCALVSVCGLVTTFAGEPNKQTPDAGIFVAQQQAPARSEVPQSGVPSSPAALVPSPSVVVAAVTPVSAQVSSKLPKPKNAPSKGTASSPLPAASTAAAPVTSMAEEIAALDVINRALGVGDAARALTLLDAYAKNFPVPRLAPEAMAMRAQSLAKLGDRTGACALGARFLAQYPTSPLCARVRALCAQ